MSLQPLSIASCSSRRLFLRGACASALGGAALALTACGGGGSGASGSAPQAAATTPAPAPATSGTTAEQDVLNFALNLHYLGAQFYAYAATGAGVAPALLGGSGAPGSAFGARAVAFVDPMLAQSVAEIAADKLGSLTVVRASLAGAAVVQPRIDLSADVGGAFSAAARAAGLAAAGTSFDPYANDDAFLLTASMFEDVTAAAHRATLPLLASGAGLEAQTASATMAAYHAGLIRTALDARQIDRPELGVSRLALAGAQAKLDPAPVGDDVVVDGGAVTDIPDVGGVTGPYARNAQRALRVLYAYAGAASAGGLFPNGMNGVIRASA